MASNTLEDNVPDDLLCPVCFELPDFEVYKCVDGHVLCKTCFCKLKECSQCGKLFSLTPPIRNRYFEAQLESLKIDCPFRSNGCTVKLRRSACNEHKNLCYFNKSRFGEFIDICKLLGFVNCKFMVNNGNTKDAVDHLVTEHRCSLANSSKFNLELYNSEYRSAAHIMSWTPVIANSEDKQCFILSMALINNAKSLGWLTVYLPYASNCDDVNKAASLLKVAYKIERASHSGWSVSVFQRPATLHEIQAKFKAMTCSLYQMDWLTSRFDADGVFNIVVKVKNEENTSYKSNKSEATLLTIPCAKVVYLKKPKPTTTVWDYNKGSAEAKFILLRQEAEFKSNRNSLRVFIAKILIGEKPYGFRLQDIEWIKNGSLFYIAQYGSTQMIKGLIEMRINFNIVDYKGFSPLFWTFNDDDSNMGLKKAKLLVENRNDFKLLSKQGESLLHQACKYSNAEAVEYLIKKGLNVNAMDCNGMTPLHYACANGLFAIEVAKALVDRGADCLLKSKDGKTAADLAITSDLRKVIESYQ